MSPDQLLTVNVLHNPLYDWLIAAAVLLGTLLTLLALRRAIRNQHARMQATPEVELMELPLGILSRTTVLFFFAVSIYAAFKTLSFNQRIHHIADSAFTIAVFFQAGVWATAAVAVWLERKRVGSHVENAAAISSLAIIDFIARALVWSLVLILTLDNLGVNITALVTGLGIGGIAVALAVQNVLGDLLASLSITLDRPFVIGDSLAIDTFNGTVEHIGIKSTRLRSVSGEQIIMSNADILKSRLRNFGRMSERRAAFTFGITYETPADLVERVPGIVRAIIEAQEPVRFDRCHFAKYGASALEYEAVYVVLTADYNRYMDIQQAINVQMFRKFAELGVQFAYPTQTLYVTAMHNGAAPAS